MLRNALEPWHLIVVVLVLVVLFGSKKLPDMARALGKSARILKSEAKAMKEDPSPGAPAGAGEATGTTAPAPGGSTSPIIPTTVESSR
ncbi:MULTISPECIES: Sec-independent protein translocase subunit TatA [Streptomyces]|uniref:Sec-independent protein translocase subunit TatA n=1 Tax=Streptomyces TaxID=1883 RepID=UPI00163C921E|nr:MULTISPECIES: Sec-independent protein translocase subunit TatA [Streptomyces]MBC2873562.1 Sec-independent protein translocase subunit TatA [Streptomyces sp. TYQ1024]UBI36863.1 Sec-independent protein translocase subunit TatA [Streptomyces mobaraensis]UKW29455.1 Sec-independent protein translocase subunit TatA [Streptomyces sp. TYQ1024]